MLQTIKNSGHHNMKNVITFVREKGPLSRADISEQMEIPQPTMTRIIEKLVNANIFKEKGLGSSTGGRRPVLLEFNQNCAYAIGIELGRSDIKVALTNMNGDLLSFRMKETTPNCTIDDIVILVKSSSKQVMQETSVNPSLVLGVGVGMPGPLNETEDGRISPPNFYGEVQVPLKEKLEQELAYPVTIDNDANVAALAEKWFGTGKEISHFAYLMADVGIGTGLIINHDIYRGMNGEAGEIGHSTIDVHGEQCSCGNYGCLETFCSVPAIINRLKRRLKVSSHAERSLFADNPDDIRIEDISAAIKNGSVLAKEILEESARYLGVGIANLINLYAPKSVIIGGKIGTLHPVILEEVKKVVQERVIGSTGKRTNIFVSELTSGVVLGAAAMVMHRTFYSFPVMLPRL